MTEFEMAQARIVELEAQLKKCKDVIKEGESKNNILQQRLDMSNSCCNQKDEEKQMLLAKIADLECKIREMTECRDAQVTEIEHRITHVNRELERCQKINDDYAKTCNELIAQRNSLEKQLSDERTRNEELTNIITDLTKSVLNLSDIIE